MAREAGARARGGVVSEAFPTMWRRATLPRRALARVPLWSRKEL